MLRRLVHNLVSQTEKYSSIELSFIEVPKICEVFLKYNIFNAF